MIKELMNRVTIGLAIGGMVTFIMLTIFRILEVNPPIEEIWTHMLGSIIVGCYFGAASLIFEVEDWSPLKQTIIHLCSSLLVFFPTAMFSGWIMLKPLPIMLFMILFFFIYALFWLSLKWYFLRLSRSMNNSIR